MSRPGGLVEHDFWLQRWEEDRTGFHMDAVNPLLKAHHGLLAGAKRVLVPLCGRTIDLWWLRDQGHEVVGVELSEKAVRTFFAEEGVAPDIHREGPYQVFTTTGITILQGDFFQLRDERFDALWDRAALIALPPQMRVRYAATVREVVDGPGLLVTMDYPQHERSGPPHAVSQEEVNRHFAGAELLEEHDITEVMQQRGWGVSYMMERAYRLVL